MHGPQLTIFLTPDEFAAGSNNGSVVKLKKWLQVQYLLRVRGGICMVPAATEWNDSITHTPQGIAGRQWPLTALCI